MSKTFKTRPLSVRLADSNDNRVSYIENHNHTNADCDLPSTVKEQIKLSGEDLRNLSCYYDFKFIGHKVCGCAMCTEKIYRKTERKKERNSKRNSIQEQF